MLDGGAGGDADRGVHLGRDDHREGGLAEAGSAGEQDVVGGGAALPGGLEDQVELLADLLLADELAEVLGAQGRLDGLVVALGGGVDDARLGVGCLGGGVVVPVHGGCLLVRTARPGGAGWSAGAVEGLQGGPEQLRYGGGAGLGEGGLGLRGDGVDGLLGLAARVAEADEGGGELLGPRGGAGGDALGADEAAAAEGVPSLSFSSRRSFCAPFFPMPGTAVRAFSSPVETARRRASGLWTPSMAWARRGPTPLAVWRSSKTCRSSSSAKPYRVRSPRGRRGRWRAGPPRRSAVRRWSPGCTGGPCPRRRPGRRPWWGRGRRPGR